MDARKIYRRQGGFTLIELMIVVVIIGILAAIAIPQFLRYQLKSKTSEAPRNLGAIRIAEEAFAAKYGVFVGSSAVPTGTPGPKRKSWDATSTHGFTFLGFSPSGTVYYQYAIGSAALTTNGASAYNADTTIDASGEAQGGLAATSGIDITIAATGDLDGNTLFGSFYLNDDNSEIRGVPPTSGETIF